MKPQATRRPGSPGAFASAVMLLLATAANVSAEGLETSLRPVPRPASLELAAAVSTAVTDDGEDAEAPATTASAATLDAIPSETVAAPDDGTSALPEGPALGPVTNLPLPRFVSLKTDEGNVRRGPSLSHRIDWVFVREDMPLQITAEYGHWRRVVDRDGLGGWVHYSLLSGSRTVIVDDDMLPLRSRPEPEAPEVALLEQGVIARLGQCQIDWCRLTAGGYRGWAPKTALWGVGADEILE